MLNNYIYKADGDDPDNLGLLIPRYIASGRLAPNGKLYPEVKTQNEDDLVPVRSIVTKRSGDPNIVTPDLLGTGMKQTDISDGSTIGIAFGTSLTENITQSLLALKHGGHERVQNLSGNFYAPKDCTFSINGQWIELKVRGGVLKYPLPSNWIGTGKDKFSTGELIGAAYDTTSPGYRLTAIIKYMKARGNPGVRYFEKNNVILADCFAYDDGDIHYKEKKNGGLEVTIGSRSYGYSPNSMYYFPEGAHIKKFQKFCSGVVDMYSVMQDNPTDVNLAFNIFRRQFYVLNNTEYEQTHIVEPGWMSEEILEILFAGLIDVKTNPNTNQIENANFQGALQGVLNKDSFFTTLSYGYSSKVLAKAIKGDVTLKNDIMTDTVLGLLMNDNL